MQASNKFYRLPLQLISIICVLIFANGCGGGGGGGNDSDGGNSGGDNIDLSAEISSTQSLQASIGPFLPFTSQLKGRNEWLLRLVDVGAQPLQILTLAERHVGAVAYTEQTTATSSSSSFFPTDLVYQSPNDRLLRIGLRDPGAPGNPQIISAENNANNPEWVMADFADAEHSLVQYYDGNNVKKLTELGASPSQASKSMAGKSIVFTLRTGGAIDRLIVAESNRLVEYDRNLANPIVWLDNQPYSLYHVKRATDGTFYILQKKLNSNSSRLLRRRAGINTDLGFNGDFNNADIKLTSSGVAVRDVQNIYFATHAELQVRNIASFDFWKEGFFVANDRLIVKARKDFNTTPQTHDSLYSVDPLTAIVQTIEDYVVTVHFIAEDNIYYTHLDLNLGIMRAGINLDGSQQQNYANANDAAFIGARLTYSDTEASSQNRIWLQVDNRILENRPANGLNFTLVTTLAENEHALRMVGKGRYLLLEISRTSGSEIADLLLFDVDNPTTPQRITTGDTFNDRAISP